MLATTLHQRGYQVIGTSRQPERYAAAVPFTLLPLDLDDAQSVANLPALLFSKVDHLGHNAVAARKNTIHDYDTYRRKADAATRKGIAEAQAPDAVVDTIVGLIGTARPRFSNPVGKMTGMILFLQQYLPKMFESAIHKSVTEAAS